MNCKSKNIGKKKYCVASCIQLNDPEVLYRSKTELLPGTHQSSKPWNRLPYLRVTLCVVLCRSVNSVVMDGVD